jgi:hypothetical protein
MLGWQLYCHPRADSTTAAPTTPKMRSEVENREIGTNRSRRVAGGPGTVAACLVCPSYP